MCLDSMSRHGCNSQQVTIDLVRCRRATQSGRWSSLGVAWSFKSVQAHDGRWLCVKERLTEVRRDSTRLEFTVNNIESGSSDKSDEPTRLGYSNFWRLLVVFLAGFALAVLSIASAGAAGKPLLVVFGIVLLLLCIPILVGVIRTLRDARSGK